MTNCANSHLSRYAGLAVGHDAEQKLYFKEKRLYSRPCNACNNNSHCWGCRASAFFYSRDANGIDPKCRFISDTFVGMSKQGSPRFNIKQIAAWSV
jgi:hypothetical protein